MGTEHIMPPDPLEYTPLNQCDANDETVFGSDSAICPDSDKSTSSIDSFRGQLKAENWHPLYRWESITRGVLVILSVVFFTLWVTSVGVAKCTYVDKYFPANEVVEYEHVKYKGDLHFTSPWRGNDSEARFYPSPDIDTAWRRITTDVKPVRITDEQLRKMGMEVTPTTVKFTDEEGGGYLASLEVNHHLQCLDMLRKAAYQEHYESFDPAFQVEDAALVNKLETCVEILRQVFMCYPDLDMMTYYWVHGFHLPFPNLNIVHRCRNFDRIMDWAAENAINAPSVKSLA